MQDLFFTLRGCTPAIEVRAAKLLSFELGSIRTGAPVTVATLLAGDSDDPIDHARHLVRIPPRWALMLLADRLGRFTIDDEPCPCPAGLARAALLHAGRAL